MGRKFPPLLIRKKSQAGAATNLSGQPSGTDQAAIVPNPATEPTLSSIPNPTVNPMSNPGNVDVTVGIAGQL